MGRLWPLNGPEQDRLWFDEVARLFGYTPEYLKEMIAEGRFPSARGEGNALFYTGDDLAAVTLLLGRWKPQKPPRTKKKPAGDSEEDED